jgi:hypothetical protein
MAHIDAIEPPDLLVIDWESKQNVVGGGGIPVFDQKLALTFSRPILTLSNPVFTSG